MTERQFQQKVLTARSDNESEFLCLSDFFQKNGINHETSCVGILQQNGRVERKHRHILNVGRALRFQANLPIEFWEECVLTTCYLINRTPSSVLKNITPYETKHLRLNIFKFSTACVMLIINKEVVTKLPREAEGVCL